MLLELDSVRKEYPSAVGAAPPLRILEGVSLRLERGRSVAVVGPSGCGKSTLLNIIGALDRPDAGSVILDGRDLVGAPARELARIRNEKVGFVFQEHHLLPQCDVLENVLIPVLAGRAVTDADLARARALLERVGLADRLHHFPGALSGGERQRVAVVRALIMRPPLLLADEPTGSLDETSADRLGSMLVEMQRTEGVAMIVVTHSSGLAERMDRAEALHEGRLVAQP